MKKIILFSAILFLSVLGMTGSSMAGVGFTSVVPDYAFVFTHQDDPSNFIYVKLADGTQQECAAAVSKVRVYYYCQNPSKDCNVWQTDECGNEVGICKRTYRVLSGDPNVNTESCVSYDPNDLCKIRCPVAKNYAVFMNNDHVSWQTPETDETCQAVYKRIYFHVKPPVTKCSQHFTTHSLMYPPIWGDNDKDNVSNIFDNCLEKANSNQRDVDADGIGNKCDPDFDNDNDGITNGDDNCLDVPNPDQADSNNDGKGDACSPKEKPVIDKTLKPQMTDAPLETMPPDGPEKRKVFKRKVIISPQPKATDAPMVPIAPSK